MFLTSSSHEVNHVLTCNGFTNQLVTSLTVLCFSSFLPPVKRNFRKAALAIVLKLPGQDSKKSQLVFVEVLCLSNQLLVARAPALVVVLLRPKTGIDEHCAAPVVKVPAFIFWQRGGELRQLSDCSLELFRLLLVLLLVLALEESAGVQELQLLEDLLH